MNYVPKVGKRKGQAPAITVPMTDNQITYLNIPLVEYLKQRGFERMTFDVDPKEKQISVRKTPEGQKGYKVIATGRRGFGISPRLSKFLPAGRYALVDKRRMIFRAV